MQRPAASDQQACKGMQFIEQARRSKPHLFKWHSSGIQEALYAAVKIPAMLLKRHTRRDCSPSCCGRDPSGPSCARRSGQSCGHPSTAACAPGCSCWQHSGLTSHGRLSPAALGVKMAEQEGAFQYG